MTRRGFTLLEVMIGLALLGLALTVLMKSTAGSIFNAEQAHMMGVVTDLARGQMLEIEEVLLKDGFTDTDQSKLDPQPFDDQGWPNIKYAYKVEAVEMPSFEELQQMAVGQAEVSARGSGAGSGAQRGSGLGPSSNRLGAFSGGEPGASAELGPSNPLEDSALGGMLMMMGGGAEASGVLGAQGGALIQAQYSMFQEILKVSVRKVTLTITYQVLGRDRDLTLVAFFTDPQAMDRVLNGVGATELGDDDGAGSESATPTASPVRGSTRSGAGRSPK